MDFKKAQTLVDQAFAESIVPALCDYVRIPNKSPLFDPEWEAHGHMDKAAKLMADWCKAQDIKGLKVEIQRLKGRTPVLFCEIPGSGPGTVLLYGHLDKQPEFTGWAEGLSPWEPVIRDGKLYGRGGADDGYAIFSSLTAIRVLQDAGRAACTLRRADRGLRGERQLRPALLRGSAGRIASARPTWWSVSTPNAATTSSCGAPPRCAATWSATCRSRCSPRACIPAPEPASRLPCFELRASLLGRVENDVTGDLLLDELHARIPEARHSQAKAAAKVLGSQIAGKMPFVEGAHAITDSPYELVLNNTWRPTLTVTGADGLPAMQNAGNVLLPRLDLKLSFRLPPSTDAAIAADAVKRALEANPPYGARVKFNVGSSLAGWNAPPVAAWLEEAMHEASRGTFGRDAMFMGTGGSIPFIGMLGERFPGTQFLVTGVLGPHSNAHGPNEFLHLACARHVTTCVAQVLAAHHKQGAA